MLNERLNLLKSFSTDLPSLIDHPISYKALRNIFIGVKHPHEVRLIERMIIIDLEFICVCSKGLTIVETVIKNFQMNVPALISEVLNKIKIFLRNEEGVSFLKRLAESSGCFVFSLIKCIVLKFDFIVYKKYGELLLRELLCTIPTELTDNIYNCYKSRFLNLCIHSYELISVSIHLKGSLMSELFIKEILNPGNLYTLIKNQKKFDIIILNLTYYLTKKSSGALLVKELDNFISIHEDKKNLQTKIFLSKVISIRNSLRKRF